MSSESELESTLAGFVCSYLHAVQDGDSSEQNETLRWVCTGLEYLGGSLLEECDGWNGWVDGIEPATGHLPEAVVAVSSVELNVRGSADWAKDARGPFWLEPFAASVRATDNSRLVGYEVKFGDAARGLGTQPYGKHIKRVDWFFPAEWMFIFSKESAPAL